MVEYKIERRLLQSYSLRPIYTIRLVAGDSYPGVCTRINACKDVTFQTSP